MLFVIRIKELQFKSLKAWISFSFILFVKSSRKLLYRVLPCVLVKFNSTPSFKNKSEKLNKNSDITSDNKKKENDDNF